MKLYMSRTVWKTPRRTRLVLSPYSDLQPCLPDYIRRGRDPSLIISSHGVQLHHLVIVPNQSRDTQHIGHRVLRTSRPEPV
jgi:hypothetical protein